MRGTRIPSFSQRSQSSTDTEASDYQRHQDESTLGGAYGKQGHICCFCGCDMRIAAILTNIFNILVCLGSAVVVAMAANGLLDLDEWFLESKEVLGWASDELQSDLQTVLDGYAWAVYTFYGLGTLLSLIGIIGAITFRPALMLTCALWYVIEGVASLVILGWGGIGILYAGLLAYPNFMLYQEQSEGIMSEENYSVEAYCCCVGTDALELTTREAIEKRVGIFSK